MLIVPRDCMQVSAYGKCLEASPVIVLYSMNVRTVIYGKTWQEEMVTVSQKPVTELKTNHKSKRETVFFCQNETVRRGKNMNKFLNTVTI